MAESQPDQQIGGMDNSVIDPLLLQQEAAVNYPSPVPSQTECSLEEVSFKNEDFVAAENNLEDRQWEGKEDLLRADDMDDLFDFSGLE